MNDMNINALSKSQMRLMLHLLAFQRIIDPEWFDKALALHDQFAATKKAQKTAMIDTASDYHTARALLTATQVYLHDHGSITLSVNVSARGLYSARNNRSGRVEHYETLLMAIAKLVMNK